MKHVTRKNQVVTWMLGTDQNQSFVDAELLNSLVNNHLLPTLKRLHKCEWLRVFRALDAGMEVCNFCTLMCKDKEFSPNDHLCQFHLFLRCFDFFWNVFLASRCVCKKAELRVEWIQHLCPWHLQPFKGVKTSLLIHKAHLPTYGDRT